MGKGKKINYIRIIIWTICLLPTGIASAIYAREPIPEIKNARFPNDALSQSGHHAKVSPLSVNDSIIREVFPLVNDTVIPLNDSIAPPDDYGITNTDSTFLYTDDSLAILLASDSARIIMSRENGERIMTADAAKNVSQAESENSIPYRRYISGIRTGLQSPVLEITDRIRRTGRFHVRHHLEQQSIPGL